MRRPLVLFATLLLLWGLLSELNHALAGLRLHVFAGALFLVHAALTQPKRSGLIVTLLGGLVCDAQTPVPMGTHMLLFAAAHLILFHARERIPRDDGVSLTLVAFSTNLILFLVFSLLLSPSSPAPGAMWVRRLIDLACSQVLVALVAPWFFSLQARSLQLVDTFADLRTRRFG